MIEIATSDAEILRCFPVMKQLRPHLSEESFVEQVRRMQNEGYVLASLTEDGVVLALAGYRVMEMLYAGRVLYVDDLVTDASSRSKGAGAKLHEWLVEKAKEQGCTVLTLDSAVHRFEAHRFYFRHRMTIMGYHFSMPLT